MTESRRKRFQMKTNSNKGMTLPFQPLNLAFQHMYYSVDMPPVSLLCLYCHRPHNCLQMRETFTPYQVTGVVQRMHPDSLRFCCHAPSRSGYTVHTRGTTKLGAPCISVLPSLTELLCQLGEALKPPVRWGRGMRGRARRWRAHPSHS